MICSTNVKQEDKKMIPRVNIRMPDLKSHSNSSPPPQWSDTEYIIFLTLTKPLCTKKQPREVTDKPTTLKLSIFMSVTDFLKGQVTV